MKIQLSCVRIYINEEILCITRLIWGDPLADGQMGKRGRAKAGEGQEEF